MTLLMGSSPYSVIKIIISTSAIVSVNACIKNKFARSPFVSLKAVISTDSTIHRDSARTIYKSGLIKDRLNVIIIIKNAAPDM